MAWHDTAWRLLLAYTSVYYLLIYFIFGCFGPFLLENNHWRLSIHYRTSLFCSTSHVPRSKKNKKKQGVVSAPSHPSHPSHPSIPSVNLHPLLSLFFVELELVPACIESKNRRVSFNLYFCCVPLNHYTIRTIRTIRAIDIEQKLFCPFFPRSPHNHHYHHHHPNNNINNNNNSNPNATKY
jgi:hypothetical protein